MNALITTVLCLCVATTANGWLFTSVKTVDQLDITKYTGQWFEMYNSLVQQQTFEKNSYCTCAIYSPSDKNNTLIVKNSGRIGAAKGKLNDIDGTVVRPDAQNAPGKLIVNFPSAPQSSKPNYLVIKLGPVYQGKYSYVIITSNYKAFTWILARDVKMFREKYEQEALTFLKNNGYNWFWNKPRKVYQEDDCIYPATL